MASMAKVLLVGNLGADAELKYTPGGAPVLEFRIATNERASGAAGGGQGAPEMVTTWFRVSLWGKQAESLKAYLVKGKSVYVDGRLRVRDWVDREGKGRYSLEVRADQVLLLGGRQDAAESAGMPTELRGGDADFNQDDIPF